MNALETMYVEHECAKLSIRYANHIDVFDDDAVTDLFAPDGVWNHMTQGPIRGRDAIRTFLNGRNRATLLRHIASNFEIEVISETKAKGKSYWTVYLGSPGEPGQLPTMGVPLSIGEYEDEFVCIDGRWYFETRTMRPLFSGA